MVYVNGGSEIPEASFGGYKMSGNGREWGEIAFEAQVVQAEVDEDVDGSYSKEPNRA
jgi:acyl-CoA reductase-like NAD-dependent aldehyde dehydrogenase